MLRLNRRELGRMEGPFRVKPSTRPRGKLTGIDPSILPSFHSSECRGHLRRDAGIPDAVARAGRDAVALPQRRAELPLRHGLFLLPARQVPVAVSLIQVAGL